MDELKAFFSTPYSYLGLGAAAIAGVWWFKMTSSTANLTLIFGVLSLTVAVFLLLPRWGVAQPISIRLLWTVTAFCVLSLTAYYSLWTTVPNKEVSPASNIFSARLNSFMTFKFIGPLLCMYHSEVGKTLAPVSIAIDVTVISLRPTLSRVYSYDAQAVIEYKKGDQLVHETHTLFTSPISTCEVYVIGDSDWAKARRLDFSLNNFDLNARDRHLTEGDSVSGWMFFEIGPTVRALDYTVRQIDLTVQNAHREKQTLVLVPPVKNELGSVISSGELHFTAGYYDLTKEKYTLTPRMDLQDILRQKREQLK